MLNVQDKILTFKGLILFQKICFCFLIVVMCFFQIEWNRNNSLKMQPP